MWAARGSDMIRLLDVLEAGDKVEANYKGRGEWFSGRIKRVRADSSYDIMYIDREVETAVSANLVRAVGKVKKSLSPARGGHIEEGSKVEANYGGRGKFYPGRVKRDHGDDTYDIDYNDGKQESRVAANLIHFLEVGHADVVQLLLSAGANIDAADKVILMMHYCMTV